MAEIELEYYVSFSWALMSLTLFWAVLYSMIWDKAAMAANIGAVKDLPAASRELWGVALTVLGYTPIKKRTEGKHVAAGEQSANVLRQNTVRSDTYRRLLHQ